MALISLNGITLSFGVSPLLDSVALQIEAGERLGLLGRNGAGKSTLLKVLDGSLMPDSGEIVRTPGLRVASLQQDVPRDLSGPVGDYLHKVCGVKASDAGWEIESRIDQAARDLKLDLAAPLEALSAGSTRRVLLGAALVRESDLLILDEPTNHLDIEAIDHLEETIGKTRAAVIFVTHDRSFLRNLATRILELDRGIVRSYPMSYDLYLERREQELQAEAEQARNFDKKLAQEEAWLRRGIKARRTRNEGRVRALEALRLERSARRDETGRVKASLQEADRSGRMVIRCEDVSFAYADVPIVRHLTTRVLRGDRIGILGPNGSGKTTVIRLMLGELAPESGTVTHGTRLEVAHFEQLHDMLDDSKTVLENFTEGSDMITVGGRERHVVGFLRDFLFSSEQIQGSILKLSGGERRRLLLAKVLSRPCNLLVLDEPTNDLDLETLELLEDLLLDFQGTLLVVSHDRAFLDNIVTSTLVFEGDGEWQEYVGGYEDWVRQRKSMEPPPAAKPAKPRPERVSAPRPRRATFKEKRELNEIPGHIERLEAEKQRLFDLLGSPDFYATRGGEVSATKEKLAAIEQEIHEAYARWLELEGLVAGEE